jgi:hypothetical protein
LNEDYHEFIVKSEKKMKVGFKKKFIFHRPDINDPSNRDIWLPWMDSNLKKTLIPSTPGFSTEPRKFPPRVFGCSDGPYPAKTHPAPHSYQRYP